MNAVPTWNGRPATDLTRDELLAAYTWAAKQLEAFRKFNLEELEMDRLFKECGEKLAKRAFPPNRTLKQGEIPTG